MIKLSKIQDGLDLAYYECDLRRKCVAPVILKKVKTLLPVGSVVWGIGSKWGCPVTILEYNVNNDGEVSVVVEKIGSKAKDKGPLFNIVDPTDFEPMPDREIKIHKQIKWPAL